MSQYRFCSPLTGLLALAGSCNFLFAQLIYVPNNGGGGSVSTFVVNPEAGTLVQVGPSFGTPGQPTALAAEPKGRFAYVTVNPPAVVAYNINASTGTLSQVPGGLQTLGASPADVKADPTGKFVYVVNPASGVVGFTINASNGLLTRVAGSPFPAGGNPNGLAIDPSGKFLYVANQGGNSVSAYTIDPGTGALAPIPGSPFPAGRAPSEVATDAAGKFVYVTNRLGNDVSVFSIDPASGALAAVPGSPFAAGAGPTAAVTDPASKFLIVSNGDDSTISVYAIDPGSGALSQAAGSPFAAERAPIALLMDPGGKYVYVSNLLGNNVSAFTLDSASGALGPVPGGPFAGGEGPVRAALLQPSSAILPPVNAASVLNAASRALPGTPNYGIAQGSTFVISGLNLGPASKLRASTFPLSRQLGGTSVKVTVGAATSNAIMVSTFVTEVVAILPSSTPVGDGTLSVTYNNRTSATIPIHVVSASPGIFTHNQWGTGLAQARNYNADDDQPPNGLTQAAHPGQTVTLQTTGLGPVTFDETQPAAAQNLRDDVEVWVGNRRASVSYSGRSPDFPGIDSITFTLPNDVPLGCYVPVAVRLATTSLVSNFAALAITAGDRICSDPHGLSSSDLAVLDAGGTLNIGWIQFIRVLITADIPGLGSGSGSVDSGWGSFFHWDPTTAAADPGMDLFTGRTVSLGGCAVYEFQRLGPGYILMHPFLNGGAMLNATSDQAFGRFVRTRYGYYEAHQALGAVAPPGISDRPMPRPFLEPGTVKVSNGPGGPDVGSFQAALSIPASPAPLAWTNLDAISASVIDRSADLTFTWNGGDPAGEYVVIAGLVMLPEFGPKVPLNVASAFVCTERVDAGQFTIPAVVLSALPASNPAALSGMLLVGRAPLVSDGLKFTAPGLDLGYMNYALFSGRTATFK